MRASAASLLVALVAASPPAAAVDHQVARLVAEGRRLYAQQQYGAAIQTMQRALGAAEDSARVRLDAYETMGCAYVALAEELDARRAFRALLVIDPYYVLREPSGSPKIRDVFEQARRELVPDAAIDPDLELRIVAPERTPAGTPVEVRVEASAPVARVTLRSRRSGSSRFERAAMTGAGRTFRTVLPLPAGRRGYGVELYAEARDAAGRVVGRGASPLEPRLLRVRALRSTRGSSGGGVSPWLWVGAGVIVAGAVVAGIVIGTGGSEDRRCGTLSPCQVELSLERR